MADYGKYEAELAGELAQGQVYQAREHGGAG